jgi:putative hydrolase of the HAD superfamily
MAVISNRDKPFHELLQKIGISGYFSYSLAAGEVNSYKPDPGVFKHALEQTGMSADESVYVGDNYFADIVGALRAGLKPVLYDPNIIFPEINCAAIRSFDELKSVIEVL